MQITQFHLFVVCTAIQPSFILFRNTDGECQLVFLLSDGHLAVSLVVPSDRYTYLRYLIKAQIVSSASCWLTPLSACVSSDRGLRHADRLKRIMV